MLAYLAVSLLCLGSAGELMHTGLMHIIRELILLLLAVVVRLVGCLSLLRLAYARTFV